jgi:sulfate transporter 4
MEHRRHPVPAFFHPDEEDGVDRHQNHPFDILSEGDEEEDDWQYKFWGQFSRTFRNKKTTDDWIATFLPAWSWMRSYQVRQTFPADLLAGITVGLMIVPQSMSYAKLAGLPVEYGLYSALMPIFAYALFGTSRQLAIGPVALISLLLSTGLTELMAKEENNNNNATTDPTSPEYMARYQQLAIQTSLLVGLTYIVMGLCRLGFVTIFLSHPVISGFTTGAAVIIGMSQVKYLFGYNIGRSDKLHELLKMIFENIQQFQYQPFLMGVSSILVLALFKHVGKTYPRFKWVRAAGPLVVTVIAIILTVTLNLKERGIQVVGTIPSGFPKVTISQWTSLFSDFRELMIVTISIVIVGFMESIAIAKQLASKHKYDIDSSKELIGLGCANFLGAMFNAYPVTGSFSRSAVNNDTGARSGVSGMVTATLGTYVQGKSGIVLLTAHFLTTNIAFTRTGCFLPFFRMIIF